MQYGRVLLTLLITILGYKLMVIALSLMNQPSDAALYGGELLLCVAVVGAATLLRLLWRRRVR